MIPKKRILICMGTRPEVIKMAPIIKRLSVAPLCKPIVCLTGQHRDLAEDILEIFNITPDYRLNVMRDGQSLSALSIRILESVDKIIRRISPAWVLVQGDTTTACFSALASFYNKIPVGHVEAGLRTNDIFSPWPEESNRRMIAALASHHFAPTSSAAHNLVKEGIPESRVTVTGNTVIDALLDTKEKIATDSCLRKEIQNQFQIPNDKKIVLLTCHRRESFGEGITNIFKAALRIADRDDTIVLFPVHPNPNVKRLAEQKLGRHRNIRLLQPLNYIHLVYLMDKASLILTDSGGLQEEAPSFGKFTLILRNHTERHEGIAAGFSKLVGTDTEMIVATANSILDNPPFLDTKNNPYGDGKAANRICTILEKEANTL